MVDLNTSFPCKVRALIDPGSELSFISERTVNLLHLTRKHASIPISEIGAVSSGHTRGLVHLKLRSIHSNTTSISVQCYILSQLTSWLPHTSKHSISSLLSPEEHECEHFVETHTRTPAGKYVVRLPLKSSVDLLGESRSLAERRMDHLIRRFDKDPIYKDLYYSFMNEFKTLKHIRKISPISVEPPLVCYIPHHGIVKLKNGIQRIRVVFNGSSRTSSNTSLNDILHTGQKLKIDITDTLLYLRSHRFVFLTDIVKMFRQILIHPDDWDLQRILWVNSQQQIRAYHLTTVIYGTRAAPFLAGRVMLQLLQDEGHRFPLATEPMTKGRYVDDISGGADSLPQLINIAQQLNELCMAGGFPLAQWKSNHPDFLPKFSSGISQGDEHTFDDSSIKVLGLSWIPKADQFKFVSNVSNNLRISKRVILSEIAQLYDPLGFISPVIIKGKILLQQLWLEKFDWDDHLSPQLTRKWTNFRDELSELEQIRIPRWLQLHPQSTRIEIHGFSDASQLAMSAVVYIKVISGINSTVSIVCSKTKVAPLKPVTIPRLELTAAALLARLSRYVSTTLNLTTWPVSLWNDSNVALTWILSHPSRWKDFVRNRVSLIQELLPEAKWMFISGKVNPDDCASRGLTAQQLSKHDLWWQGPSWLTKTSDRWPHPSPSINLNVDLEERPGLSLAVTQSPPKLWDLCKRYSSLNRLLQITAICQRVASLVKHLPKSSLSFPLSVSDLETARKFWIQSILATYFSDSIKLLSQGYLLPKSHPLSRLTPFIDHSGILRIGGRLNNSQLGLDSKHPIILPKYSPLSNLLITDSHLKTLHGGTQITLTHIRQSYWIIGGRAPVRSHILKCVKCYRYRGERAQQLMGQLPATRVTASRPFLNTGVDYAGPLSIKTWRGRGAKSHKGWLAIFVCFSTSAIHLEAVTDYSADTFLAAYRRFSGRRGICEKLYSDCGTNFLGADSTLKQLFSAASQEYKRISQLLASDGTSWQFNPPGAPHFGGKWEAAVKSVKFHLRRTIGDLNLTFEDLNTLLIQIEAVLNSRPLTPLSDDPENLSALTPGHFLIGEPLTTIPEPSLSEIPVSRLDRWQLIQQRLQYFWSRWSTECLQRHLSISKWHHPSNEIKEGSLILITDEKLPPAKWPLAQVTSLHPGHDGLTRVVTLKTATTTLQRPIVKLAPLPVEAARITS